MEFERANLWRGVKLFKGGFVESDFRVKDIDFVVIEMVKRKCLRIVLDKFVVKEDYIEREVLICWNCRYKCVEVFVESLGGWYDVDCGVEVWYLRRFDLEEKKILI